jgi:hypothetical protein
MNHLNLTIPVSEIPNEESLITVINIGDDNFLTLELRREKDGSLYYLVFEDANPLGEIIEGHYPDYFPEGDYSEWQPLSL